MTGAPFLGLRGVRLSAFGAALGGASLLAGAAFAGPPDPCVLPCVIDTGDYLEADYTVPSDGKTYRWDIFYETDDPAGYVTLDAPSQVEAFLLRSLGGGATQIEFSLDVDYVFTQLTTSFGVVSYRMRAPADFDNCTAATPAGEICGATYNVFGNGTRIHAFGGSPVTLVGITSTEVPEPGAWGLMILGFGGVGSMVRRRRWQGVKA